MNFLNCAAELDRRFPGEHLNFPFRSHNFVAFNGRRETGSFESGSRGIGSLDSNGPNLRMLVCAVGNNKDFCDGTYLSSTEADEYNSRSEKLHF